MKNELAQSGISHRITMRPKLELLSLTGWLVPSAIGFYFFGRWITEIVIPTLKGGNFNQLYDFHQTRYLDTTLVCVVIAFLWLSVVMVKFAKRFQNLQ